MEIRKYGDFSDADKQRIAGRVLALQSLWVKFKVTDVPAEIRGYLSLDVLRLENAVGAYWNDLNRLKARHDIKDRLHRSKIAAYTIKWVLHFCPAISIAGRDQLAKLTEENKLLVLRINQLFAIHCLFFCANTLKPEDFRAGGRFHRILRDLLYYICTAAYQEKMAAVLFDALIIASNVGESDE